MGSRSIRRVLVHACLPAVLLTCLMISSGCRGDRAERPVNSGTESVDAAVTRPVAASSDMATVDAERQPPTGETEQPTLAELLLGSDAAGGGPVVVAQPDLKMPDIGSSVLRQFQLRKIVGKHLTLITDLDEDSEVDELPQVFDLAVPAWAKYFKTPEADLSEWHQVGYLMNDRGRFVKAGLLPPTLPDFLHGYHVGDQLWVLEQPSAYYRRHLVLHEGVHGFMKHVLGGTGPPWYREGMAELLATHRWSDGDLELGVMPNTRDEVPEWGRIKLIRDEFAAGRGLMLRNVAVLGDADFLDVESYAWSWAACAYFDGHPTYQERFRAMRQHVAVPPLLFNQRLNDALDGELRELDEQWQLFVMNADYGYDFARNAVEYKRGRPFPVTGVELTVQADRGWQSSGYQLLAGKRYLITAAGRFQVLQSTAAWMSEPNGITLRYHAGLPLGMLVGNVRLDDANVAVTNLGTPIAIGLRRHVQPVETGVLYLKINDHPGELADNVGSVNVRVIEVE